MNFNEAVVRMGNLIEAKHIAAFSMNYKHWQSRGLKSPECKCYIIIVVYGRNEAESFEALSWEKVCTQAEQSVMPEEVKETQAPVAVTLAEMSESAAEAASNPGPASFPDSDFEVVDDAEKAPEQSGK